MQANSYVAAINMGQPLVENHDSAILVQATSGLPFNWVLLQNYDIVTYEADPEDLALCTFRIWALGFLLGGLNQELSLEAGAQACGFLCLGASQPRGELIAIGVGLGPGSVGPKIQPPFVP